MLWAVGVTLLGHFLGEIDFIRQHIELAILAVVLVSLLPLGIEFVRSRRAARHAPGDAGDGTSRHADVTSDG
jgi:membrane-associated protein